MIVEVSEACRAAAEATVREFNARWNVNLLHVRPVPGRYFFARDELAPLEASPGWRTAAEIYTEVRKAVPAPNELVSAGRQLGVLYVRGYRSPGPRSYYWVAPQGSEPTATDYAVLRRRAR